MDTKSRNIRYAAWIKLLAALLCLIGPLATAWGLRQAYNFRYFPYGDDYLKSDDFSNDIVQYYDLVRNAAFNADKESLDTVNRRQGMSYWARRADGTVLTNLPAGSDPDGFFGKLNGRIVARPNPDTDHEYLSDGSGNSYSYSLPPEGAAVYVGMSEDTLRQNTEQFRTNRALGVEGVYLFGGGLLVFFAGLVWLVYTAGRRPGAEGVRLLGADAVYLDVGFVVAAIVEIFCTLGLYFLYGKFFEFKNSINLTAVYVTGALLTVCMSVALMLYCTSFSRCLKRGELLKHTLVYKVFSCADRIARDALGAGVLALKAALLFAAYAAASSLMFLCFLETARMRSYPGMFFSFLLFAAVNISALVYILRKIAALRRIIRGVETIRAGTLAFRVPGTGGAPFPELAASVNGIAEGLSAAVENEVKAERMKAELVTNVSHDLKTPLTSIITYIDLLKAEGPSGEHAAQYIDVLDAKAKRLKALTEDLFEAAKAASGSIKPNLERVDIGELIAQGLGELSDRIRESGLDFRFTAPERQLFIMADGRLLWRVMENLFSNVFKYAQPSSRVYIAAAAAGGRAVITVKNISAAELNMPAEALMERFTRGDASRHSEGSGLGLAIARSLVELQGGRFFVEIDGDLFKASMEFGEVK